MFKLRRFSFSDDLSRRYARARLTVYGAAGAAIASFFITISVAQPSFPILVTVTLIFAIALVVAVLHNPLGLLTMRAQLKVAAREIAFDEQGFTVLLLSGAAERFDNPALELFYLPGHAGDDYYLQVKDENARTGSFYLGNRPEEMEPMIRLLEADGLRAKYEEAYAGKEERMREHHDRLFR